MKSMLRQMNSHYVFRHTDFSNFLMSLVILAFSHKLLFLGEVTEDTWDTNLITKILKKNSFQSFCVPFPYVLCNSPCWAGLTSKIQPRSYFSRAVEAGARDTILNLPKSPDAVSETKQRCSIPLLCSCCFPHDVAIRAVRRGSAGQAGQNHCRGGRQGGGG
jgi:hypothetical protein